MKGTRIGMAAAMLLLLPAAGWARPQAAVRVARPTRIALVSQDQYLDINRIRMLVTNIGSFAYDIGTQTAALEFPKGSGNTAVYAAGIWLGGMRQDTICVAVMDYSSEYGPGVILPSGLPDDPTRPEYVVYKLNRADSTGIGLYNYGAVPYGAPPVNVNADGTLDIVGDQMLWSVFNDADRLNHINQAGQTPPLGVEVQQTIFAFNRQGPLGQSLFVRYKIINKSGTNLDDMYVSQWCDPDLGNYLDDLVGCDVALSMGFCYNADNNDEGYYGASPPAVGLDFFRGPIGYGGTVLGLTSFNKYINGTDPDNYLKTYNFMKGLNPDGTPLIDPVTGQVTTYFVSGDPVSATGWLDTNPADRRMMLSSGPFPMAPGDTQEVVVGLVIGDGSNRLSSVALLRFYDRSAQSAFEQDFQIPSPPAQPVVSVTPRDGSAYLSWDSSSENFAGGLYKWEGYVVYQGSSRTGPFQRVATFDLNDGITTVLDDGFDEQSGQILPRVSALGNDGGLKYQILIDRDLVRGGPLRVGTPYYFTVNAYAVGTGLVPQVLESPDNVITVVPQTPAAGVDWGSAGLVAGPTAAQRSPGATLPSTDDVTVDIVDPDKVITASYEVGYKPTPSGDYTWYLTRTTAAGTDTVVNDWDNYSGDDRYPVVDGLQIKVVGGGLGELFRVQYDDVGANPPAFVGFGADLGLAFFDGSADYARALENLIGVSSSLDPADTSQFDNVEIRFTGGVAGQKAYRYMRCDPCDPRTYLFQDFVDVPFTVWDIDRERQLNAAFVENEGGTPNGQWDPDVNPDPFVDRQMVLVFGSSYSATADPLYTTTYPDLLNDSANLDLMYVFWPRRVQDAGGAPIPEDAGDKVAFLLATRSANDYFTFSTRAPSRFNADLARGELARVRAVPNPYLTRSRYEPDAFHRSVKFTHLPARCTLRIFTLAGDLVRTLEKNDASSELSWDLLTEHRLPVASGIYIYHVDAPGVGTTTGKVVIFMEKERLNTL
jgi:hypothetical protein